jgi:hypothetical protein
VVDKNMKWMKPHSPISETFVAHGEKPWDYIHVVYVSGKAGGFFVTRQSVLSTTAVHAIGPYRTMWQAKRAAEKRYHA